jgi:hypothetical protein
VKRVALAVLLACLPVQSIAVTTHPLPPHDGDTFKTLQGRTARMYGFDATEISQARPQSLDILMAGIEARIEIPETKANVAELATPTNWPLCQLSLRTFRRA